MLPLLNSLFHIKLIHPPAFTMMRHLICFVALLAPSYGGKLADESYEICQQGANTNTLAKPNNTGYISFNSTIKSISCSVNLNFPPGSVDGM